MSDPSPPQVNNTNSYEDNEQNNKAKSKHCCGELKLSFFGTTDATGKPIDFAQSLGASHPFIIVLKLVIFGLLFGSLFYGFNTTNVGTFRLAYLTIWSLIWANIYCCLSIYLSLSTLLSKGNQPTYWIANWCWVWYSVATTHAIVVFFMFWSAEYDPERYPKLEYDHYMDHGGSALLLLIEGLVLNRVPIRIKHYLGCLVVASAYVIWSAIHDVLLEHNPNSSEDKDAPLYSVLSWETDLQGAIIVTVAILFVALPLVQILIWSLSLFGRRYITDNDDKKETAGGATGAEISTNDVESPSSPSPASYEPEVY